jgi:hypothetical protein
MDGYYTKNINASKIGIAPIFTVTFRATSGGDDIKPLRRLLKYALRACGLRAIDIHQSPVSASLAPEEPAMCAGNTGEVEQ